ncbi:MAG TPA: geranylgeranyl reductase family protein [Anaerolineaceae bacterium]|nr:geranylgeranyl reductase family protein [Anaerolineaceae bacterium]
MRTDFDVIVVGAGPGGATAAFDLGEAGKKVLMIEKENLPRYKTCGGGVSLKMLEQFPFSFEPVIESRVSSVFYDFGQDRVNIPVENGSIGMVMRDRFDAHILAHAKADVNTRCTVRSVRDQGEWVEIELENGKTLRSAYLVGADGANSVVARSLQLRKRRALVGAIEVEADAPADIQHYYATRPVFIFGEIKRGYAWVFPKRDHLSVGIGCYRPKTNDLRGALQRVMDRYGIPIKDMPSHGHPIPIFTRQEHIATARVALIGDAAGLVDPFTGEGIRFAITSARIAADAIIQGDLHWYERTVQARIGSSHLWGLNLARLFFSIPELCYALGVANPQASAAFTRMLAGQATYPGVIFRLFATLPVHLARETAAIVSQSLLTRSS